MSKAWMYDERIIHSPIPARCPACKATFDPLMRGQVAETFLTFPTGRTCLICWACKEIVGYESVEGGYRLIPVDQIGKTIGTRLEDFFSNLVTACGLFMFGVICLISLIATMSFLALYWLLLAVRDGRRNR